MKSQAKSSDIARARPNLIQFEMPLGATVVCVDSASTTCRFYGWDVRGGQAPFGLCLVTSPALPRAARPRASGTLSVDGEVSGKLFGMAFGSTILRWTTAVV